MDKNQELAQNILESVGGNSNVLQVTHCMTRLRLNLVDDSIVDTNEVKQIPGVLGVSQKGGQYQIIIGQTVPHVYDAFKGQLEKSDISVNKNESEKKQVEKEPFSLKKLGNAMLDGLAGSLTPLIPVLVAVSMFKMVVAVFGPSMLGVIAEGSQLYQLLTMVGDAGFYFFPILLGYTASKKLGATPVLGMLLGAILVHPTLIQIATEGQEFSVYGISANAQNYSNTVIPIILSVWVMVYVEKFYKKIVPTTLATVFSPALAIATMLPIMLIVLGPIGFRLGEYLSRFLLSLDSVAGFLAVAIIAALWQFLVMTGMHLLLITTMITVFAQNGQEALVSPAAIVASICVAGMSLGSFLSLRKKDERALAFSFLVASFIGGVTEPALYGLGARYKKPFIGLVIGGFAGGVYAGITGVTTYAMIPVASFIAMTAFFGGTTANTINGLISCGIGFVISAGVTYVLGVRETKEEVKLVEKILFRADDLGYSEGINYGIEKSVKEGLIGSVGVMLNMDATAHGVSLLKNENIAFGQHTNICVGRPLTDPSLIPSLVDEAGFFKSSKTYRTAEKDFVVVEEALLEIKNQYNRFIELFGRKPDYFEGHAIASDNFFVALKQFSIQEGLTYSGLPENTNPNAIEKGSFIYINQTKSYLIMESMKPDYDPYQTLKNLSNQLHEDGVNIFVCHPGYLDAYILKHSSLLIPRTQEVEMLIDPKVKQELAEKEIELIDYRYF